jgi:hypothetical protein
MTTVDQAKESSGIYPINIYGTYRVPRNTPRMRTRFWRNDNKTRIINAAWYALLMSAVLIVGYLLFWTLNSMSLSQRDQLSLPSRFCDYYTN